MGVEGFYRSYKDVPSSSWRWPSFTPYEVRCGIGPGADKYRGIDEYGIDSVFVVPDAMDRLQLARDISMRAFVINSAYRTAEYNRAIGGAPNSYHTMGMAFDINLAGHDRMVLRAALISAGFTGIGQYRGFIHADTRPGPLKEFDRR